MASIATRGAVYDFNNYVSPTNVLRAPSLTIYDTGGNDTLDASGYSAAGFIDLTPGYFSSLGGFVHNLGIFTTTVIENAIGGSGNDTIVGNSADNTLTGGAGNDAIDGGSGTDTAVFSGARANYTISVQGDGSIRIVDNRAGSLDGTDVLSHVEFLRFSDVTTSVGQPSGTPAMTVAGTGHFNNDAMSDILSFHDGTLATWLMNGATGTAQNVVYSGFGSGWQVVGGGDFNNDGNGDILFLNTSGAVAIWEMNGSQILAGACLPSAPGGWHVAGVGDFNNDHMSDILLLNNNGTFAMWEMNGPQVQAGALLPSVPGGWQVAGVGDFNGDHMSDILLFLPNGTLALWEMNGTQVQAGAMLPSLDSSWRLPAVGDFNNDGRSDIVLQNVSGTVAIWEMNGLQIQSGAVVGSMSRDWHIVGVADFNGDHMSDILWQNDSGALQIWQMNGLQVTALPVVLPSGGNLPLASEAHRPDGSTDLPAPPHAAPVVSEWLAAGEERTGLLQAIHDSQLPLHVEDHSSRMGWHASVHAYDLI